MRRRYYSPMRAAWQGALYKPVETFWNRWGASLPNRLDDRIGAWLYCASGAGRRPTRKEAKRRRALMASLPLVPRATFQRPPAGSVGVSDKEAGNE